MLLIKRSGVMGMLFFKSRDLDLFVERFWILMLDIMVVFFLFLIFISGIFCKIFCVDKGWILLIWFWLIIIMLFVCFKRVEVLLFIMWIIFIVGIILLFVLFILGVFWVSELKDSSVVEIDKVKCVSFVCIKSIFWWVVIKRF